MLNLFGQFVVPGVEGVAVYHDDEDDQLFYMLPGHPSFSRTDEGKPTFSVILYGHQDPPQNVDLQPEGGFAGITTEISVSDDQQAAIRDYVQNGYHGVRPVYVSPGPTGFAPMAALSQPVRLTYPLWTDGQVDFCLTPPAKGQSATSPASSGKPSLMATNTATCQIVLDQAAAISLRSEAARGRMPGSVTYGVRFAGRLPSLTIHLAGKMSEVYGQIKQNCLPFDTRTSRYYACPASLVGGLDSLQAELPGLKVEVDSDHWESAIPDPATAQEVGEKLNAMALRVVTDYLMNRFFTADVAGSLASDPTPAIDGPEGSHYQGDSLPGGQMWLKSFTPQELQDELDFLGSAGSSLGLTLNATRLFSDMLTIDEVKQSLIGINLNDPFFQFLDVKLRVVANFGSGEIAAIKVILDYNQRDEATGAQITYGQDYLFLTGQEEVYFRGRLAKDQSGKPKNTYTYRYEIYYKGSAQPDKTPPQDTQDAALAVDCSNLTFVSVQATWGAVPETVQSVQIHFRYPGLDLPTAENDVNLSSSHTTGSWFTFTRGDPSLQYEYQVSFFRADGGRVDLPMQQGSSSTLVVNADPTLFADLASTHSGG